MGLLEGPIFYMEEITSIDKRMEKGICQNIQNKTQKQGKILAFMMEYVKN